MGRWTDGEGQGRRCAPLGAPRRFSICVTPIAPLLPVWTVDVLHTHAPSTAPDRAGACAARAQTGRSVTRGANASLQLQHGPGFVRTPPTLTLPSVGRSPPFFSKYWWHGLHRSSPSGPGRYCTRTRHQQRRIGPVPARRGLKRGGASPVVRMRLRSCSTSRETSWAAFRRWVHSG
jgi:hypothetical protein